MRENLLFYLCRGRWNFDYKMSFVCIFYGYYCLKYEYRLKLFSLNNNQKNKNKTAKSNDKLKRDLFLLDTKKKF